MPCIHNYQDKPDLTHQLRARELLSDHKDRLNTKERNFVMGMKHRLYLTERQEDYLAALWERVTR